MKEPNFQEIEKKWNDKWESKGVFEANPSKKKKYFLTYPFMYVNGPAHIGHAFTATRVDVMARFKRMQGFNVLFPWAWHLTGQPIVGMANRIKKGDPLLIRSLQEIDKVPEGTLKKFVDPIFLANYYRKEIESVVKRIGYSVDWRRQFTTIDPAFQKFVEWQYLSLKDKGYVVKGTHPVVYCPFDDSPTGDHDRLEGVGVSPTEFIIMKFQSQDFIFPCATIRPETIYGVTNIWVNPESDYAIARINHERWVVSEASLVKFENQGFSVIREEKISAQELIGKVCKNPVTGNSVMVLPAGFVNPKMGTGVVMSVPSHAPFDYAGLKDLWQSPETLKQFKLDPQKVKGIKPISMIHLEGYSENPAVDVVEKMQIKNQKDPRLKELTDEIYKREFHKGKIKSIAGKFSGQNVSEVKQVLTDEFLIKKIAAKFYDLLQPVVCRCGTENFVKILQDQWFLKYSDQKWKDGTREAIKSMQFYPEESRNWFLEIVDWLEDKACTRKSGLGTKLPWDKEWMVETLSDSTIYMAFYTISHLLKWYLEGLITPESLTREVFDFIFLGIIPKKKDKNFKIWEKMREQFLYWYPVDFRNSAKELIPNHLTFYIFHHVAMFDQKLWPKSIGVNGMINIEGQKMSKSKGNFITLRDAINSFGADTIRFTLMNSLEGMQDADFRNNEADTVFISLKNFYSNFLNLLKAKTSTNFGNQEKWLLSKMQKNVKSAEESYGQSKIKSALQFGFFEMNNNLKWYLRRVDAPNRKVMRDFLMNWLKVVSPVIPFLSEDLWEKLGGKDFISLSDWPVFEKDLADLESEQLERMVEGTLRDVRQIQKIMKKVTKKVFIIIAKDDRFKKSKLKKVAVMKIFKDSEKFFERELNCKVAVEDADRSELEKANKALPEKPAIYIEE